MEEYNPLKNNKFTNAIIKAASENKLIVFLGAGISKLCGLPLWGELAKELLSFCLEFGDRDFTYSDYEIIINKVKDSRKLITIAKSIFYRNNKRKEFEDKLYKSLTIDFDKLDDVSKQNYKSLPTLIKKISNIIVTTNADVIFDGNDDVVYDVKDFNKKLLNDGDKVIHIHGSIKDFNSMVFSVNDYLIRYGNNRFKNFVSKNILGNLDYTIVFVGYSLSELALLDLLISPNDSKERIKRTFLVDGYFSYESPLMKEDEQYYEEFGIDLIPYLKDKNGFQELVNVINGLSDIVDKRSLKRVREVANIADIIHNKKPTKKNFDNFKKRFASIDRSKQKYLLTKIATSNYKDIWIKAIINDCYFSNENENIDYLKTNKLEMNVLHEFYLNYKTDDVSINRFIRKTSLKIIKASTQLNNIKKGEYVFRLICEKVSKDLVLLSNRQVFNFIKKYSSIDQFDYWCLALCYKNDSLTKTSKTNLIKYLGLFLNYFYKTNDKHYYFDEFIDSYGAFYLNEYPTELFDVCFKKLNKKIKKDKYIMWSQDCFCDIETSTHLLDVFNKIIALALKSIDYLNSQKVEELYIRFSDNENEFYKALSIYILNKRFLDLRQFLNKALNPTDRHLFAEIYCLIENNINVLTEEEYKEVVDYVRKIEFDGYSVIWNDFARFKTLQLMSKCKHFANDFSAQEMYKSISEKLLSDHSNIENEMPSPHNMSKSIWVKSFTSNKCEIPESFFSMPATDFVDYLNNHEDDMVKSTALNVFRKNLKSDLYFDELLLQKDFLNKDIILTIVSVLLSENGVNNPIEKLLNLLTDDIADYKEIKKATYSYLYFYISNNIKELISNKKIKNSLFEFAFSDVILDENDFEELDDYDSHLINSKGFCWLVTLFMLCPDNKWESLKQYVLTLINKTGVVSTIAKASMVSSSFHIWKMDPDFYKNNLNIIFNNLYHEKNYSFAAFDYSLFYDSHFVIELYKNGILKKMLNSKDFSRSWNYIYLIINLYVEKYIDEIILKEAISSKESIHGINYFISNLFNKDYIYERINILGELFNAICINKYDDGDHLAIELIRKSELLYEVPHYFDLVINLLSIKNSSTYADDLTGLLKNSPFTDLEKERIVMTYLEYVDTAYYFTKEILELFDSIKWSDENNKNYTITKLIDKNPQFSESFNLKHSKEN